jgi:hypothetical protein
MATNREQESYTAISSQGNKYINILDSRGNSKNYFRFPHKSLSMNGKLLVVVGEDKKITYFDEMGRNQRQPTGMVAK